jgi:hypothetical protein
MLSISLVSICARFPFGWARSRFSSAVHRSGISLDQQVTRSVQLCRRTFVGIFLPEFFAHPIGFRSAAFVFPLGSVPVQDKNAARFLSCHPRLLRVFLAGDLQPTCTGAEPRDFLCGGFAV